MQKDFHYYCTAVIAWAAGYTIEEALTIAYASQYVDDATENTIIVFDNSSTFMPFRTAYLGLNSFAETIQNDIFIPFHFLPPNGVSGSLVTVPNSNLANEILDAALAEQDNELLRLIRTGIALHSFADTWSHQRFSGRHHPENNVSDISFFEEDEWDESELEKLWELLPQIGHGEAGLHPDMPFLKWKYINRYGDEIIRDNTNEYMKAVDAMYEKIKIQENESWPEIRNNIHYHLSKPTVKLERRCEDWNDYLNYLLDGESDSFAYNVKNWRDDALVRKESEEPDDVEAAPSYVWRNDFYSTKWALFYEAAKMQRDIVLAS